MVPVVFLYHYFVQINRSPAIVSYLATMVILFWASVIPVQMQRVDVSQISLSEPAKLGLHTF